jgi:hypothetical protein
MPEAPGQLDRERRRTSAWRMAEDGAMKLRSSSIEDMLVELRFVLSKRRLSWLWPLIAIPYRVLRSYLLTLLRWANNAAR